MPELQPLRCSGCRRQFGWSWSAIRGAMYCSPYCANVKPAGGHELRDDVVAMLYRLGKSTVQIAMGLDMSRQRVGQVLSHRGLASR